MILSHLHFGIVVNTLSKKVKNLIKKLNILYDEIPKTKCLHCPGKNEVSAECCKSFFPPINFIEFINIYNKIIEKNEQKEISLILKCIDSFSSEDYFKKCIFLNNQNQCEVYKQRPLSCRLFGLYTDGEYQNRAKKILNEIPKHVKIPFIKQCKNLEYIDGKKEIFSAHSDRIFKDIHKIDMEFFDIFPKKQAKKIVMSSFTYMPFDAHLLSIFIGPESLDWLARMKNNLRKIKENTINDSMDIEKNMKYKKFKKTFNDFVKSIKNNIKKSYNKELLQREKK